MKLAGGRRANDLVCRSWARWDVVGVRPELRRMILEGALTPTDHPNVIDLGCGSGANAVFLATHGFQVAAVDVLPVGLRTTERGGLQIGVTLSERWGRRVLWLRALRQGPPVVRVVWRV
jgi:2-polyprenyl-3-methyl-5-hydroxy-6-metoxy-1,4-benzoquinol methylase